MAAYKSSAEESVRQKSTKESSVYKGSDEYFEYFCDPCSTAGDHVEAHGFCTNCEEYLCSMCFRSHSRSKVLRDHVLLDKDKMPKKSVTFCNPCSTAGVHVEAQGFCTNCEEYLCSMCFRSHSRSKVLRDHVLLDKDKMPKKSVKLCDPCKTVGDKTEAAGYCTDCDEHLCESCYKSHAGSKVSKHHVLIDRDNIPRKGETIASSLAVLNIGKRDADSQNYVEEYTHIRDINVASADDETKCLITDMTMVSSSELILVDYNNKCLKLVDVENRCIKGSLKLEAKPLGVTMNSQDQVAVVLDKLYKINIVSVSGGLTVLRTLKTTGTAVDITYINGSIYVSFWNPRKFQILQPTGAVFKTIKPDPEVLKYCTFPRKIAVSRDESMIYISDWENNTVICMDMNGKMVSKFNGELDYPYDITISQSGSVYLCISRQHVVYKMTSNLTEATVILGPGDGLSSPAAMCFDADKQLVFISSRSHYEKYRNFIKVYSWK